MADGRGGRDRPPQSPPQPPPLANRYWNIQDILAEAEVRQATLLNSPHCLLLHLAKHCVSQSDCPLSFPALSQLITCEFTGLDALDLGYLDPENQQQHVRQRAQLSAHTTISKTRPCRDLSADHGLYCRIFSLLSFVQLPANASISLPFWTVSILTQRLPRDVAYSLPPIYNPLRNASLLADPRAFNLSLYPHYYTLAALLYQLPTPPTASAVDEGSSYQQQQQLQYQLLRHMTQVMDERYKEIVTKSASCSRSGRRMNGGGMSSELLRSGGECGFLSSPGVEAAAKLSVWERDLFGWNALALRKFEWWKGQIGTMRLTERNGGGGKSGGLVERKRVYGGGGESGPGRDRNKRGR